jgi:hypothetical protein
VFPDDYKRQLREEGPIDRLCGEAWLMLYPAHDLVDLNRAYDRSESHPGLVFIGSDGGGEGIVFDFRHAPPPVVLVNFVSAGWEDARRPEQRTHRHGESSPARRIRRAVVRYHDRGTLYAVPRRSD